LRTTFKSSNDGPIQIIAPELKLAIAQQDLQALAPAAQAAEVKRLAALDAQQPFDLVQGPLIRLRLLRLAETIHVLFISLHHSVFDGWSLQVLFQEVARFYAAYQAGESPAIPPLPIQYADFAHWQRTAFQSAGQQKQIAYWKEKLAGTLPVLQLPTDHPRPVVQSFRGKYQPIALPVKLQTDLQTLSREE